MPAAARSRHGSAAHALAFKVQDGRSEGDGPEAMPNVDRVDGDVRAPVVTCGRDTAGGTQLTVRIHLDTIIHVLGSAHARVPGLA